MNVEKVKKQARQLILENENISIEEICKVVKLSPNAFMTFAEEIVSKEEYFFKDSRIGKVVEAVSRMNPNEAKYIFMSNNMEEIGIKGESISPALPREFEDVDKAELVNEEDKGKELGEESGEELGEESAKAGSKKKTSAKKDIQS